MYASAPAGRPAITITLPAPPTAIGKSAAAKAALTQGFANDQPAQMGSSQRIMTGVGAAPGRTLISRRTSRKPGRVPTSV